MAKQIDLAQLPQTIRRSIERCSKADTIGMFQVESRAQMACAAAQCGPTRFYDIVVQVAIIRPGPIVGKMMNPYMQRRQGQEKVTYPASAARAGAGANAGRSTVSGATAAHGDGRRRISAEGRRRNYAARSGCGARGQRCRDLEVKLREGMTANGIDAQAQEADHPVHQLPSRSMDFRNRMPPALR